MILILALSYVQKKRLREKLDGIFFETRELNLRMTIVETRLEERLPANLNLAIPIEEKSSDVIPKRKRGRPRKDPPL